MSYDEFEAIWPKLMSHPKARVSYPNGEAAKAGMEFYFTALEDIPANVLTAAVRACAATSEFLPTPAGLREWAMRLCRPRLVTGLEAWGAVLEAIRTRKPIEDELTLKIVRGLGGLHAIGQTDVADLGVARAHFCKAYDAHVEREHELLSIPESVRALAAGTVTQGALTDGYSV